VTYYGWHDLPQGLWIINEYFKVISSTDKSDNLTCEIIYDNLTCENYRFSIIAFLKKLSLFKDCSLYNKQKNTCVLGNTRFISRVEHDIMFNTRNKSGISAHPCIILYIFYFLLLRDILYLLYFLWYIIFLCNISEGTSE
jgi:hypothetical protein